MTTLQQQVDEIMQARGDLPMPETIEDSLRFLSTEWAELSDAILRQNPYYERNNAKAHTPAEEISDSHHMLMVSIAMLQDVASENFVFLIDKYQEHEETAFRGFNPSFEEFEAFLHVQDRITSACTNSVNHKWDQCYSLMYKCHVDLMQYGERFHSLQPDEIHRAAVAKLQRRKRKTLDGLPRLDLCTIPDCNGTADKQVGQDWVCYKHFREVSVYDR